MATAQKIKLKDKKTGAEISVTPSAYQMRKPKYDSTHTIVKEVPRATTPMVPDPPAPPDDAPDTDLTQETAGNAQQELDTHEEPATKQRNKPGPKPKNQDAQ